MSADLRDPDDEANETTTTLYMVVGIVCICGMLMIAANALQPTSPSAQTLPADPNSLPNPFRRQFPGLPTTGGDLERVTGSIADGTEAVSSVVQTGAGALQDGMSWVRGTLEKPSADSDSPSRQ